MDEEWSLLSAWQSGDEKAADQLIDQNFLRVSRFFRSKLGDDVDDLIQQTFLACVESKQRIEGQRFRSYLFGIARRKLYDHLRRRYRLSDAELSTRSLIDLGTSPSQALMRQEGRQQLMLAMAQLPLEIQITLQLTYWEELSGKEIAAITEVAEPTVRSRQTRGRELLRGFLAELER